MKHCTTDKCPQILDSSCVFYEGTSLIFSGINTNDSVEVVIQKLNLKLESIPGINLDNYYNKQDINNFLSSKADISSLSQVAFSGKYDDLLNKPTIPTKTSDLENDSEFIDYNSLNIELIKKQDKLSSFDESILIESDGNIESNVSLFEEYFEQQECELNFTPIQIVAVYQDGIKLLNSEYEIILPKKIRIKEYVDENIQIEYTHLKS